MIRPIVFTDLDDTLFQTARKCPDEDVTGLIVMSTLADGKASGYATARQQNLLGWLRQGSVIPVTARSSAVLARVAIEQAPAICSNGGCIIGVDGAIDLEWHSLLASKASSDSSIQAAHALFTNDLDSSAFRHWIVAEAGLDLYIVIKSNLDDDAALQTIAGRILPSLPSSWRIHRNGNNLALLPGWLNKRHAVAYLIDRLREDSPDTPIVGIGDSSSDVGFMDLCDFAMVPTISQIWSSIASASDWVR
jgi:hydroxymethylpyrimidine pyrophosphatase-like HAD family hydrolase